MLCTHCGHSQLCPGQPGQCGSTVRVSINFWVRLDIDPMLFYCWPTVGNGGPTLNQHWVNILSFLGSEHDTLTMCSFNVGPLSAMLA